MCDTSPGLRCPKLHRRCLTFQSDFFASHLLHDLLDFDADGEEVVGFECVVGVPVHETGFPYAGLTKKEEFDCVGGGVEVGLWRDGH